MEIMFRVPKKLDPLAKKWMNLQRKLMEWSNRGVDKTIAVERNQKVFWREDTMVEFWLDGFNDNGLDVAFSHIVEMYDKILCNDSQWHYFYEDYYTLIRCSYKYAYDVKKYMDDNSIVYKWPVSNWIESSHVTKRYQSIYKEIFHNLSVLIIHMFKNEDGEYLEQAGDRIIHPFFIQAMYLADIDGQLEDYKKLGYEPMYWEATRMSSLANFRSYYIGQIKGNKNTLEYYKRKQDKLNKEESSEESA